MRSNSSRIAVGVAALAVIVALFVVLNGGEDSNDSTTTTTTTTTRGGTTGAGKPDPVAAPPVVRVRGGKPVGGITKLTFRKGDRVRFKVDSDIADEIHVHGYDVTKDVPAGGSVTLTFRATFEGIFEVELHGQGEQIAQLTVRPS